MMERHLARATDAVAHADLLRADLLRLSQMLDRLVAPADAKILRERSHLAQCNLEAISGRLDALHASIDPGRYPLSEAEHVAIDSAGELRDSLAEFLAGYQRSAPDFDSDA